jgi:peptidoglycan/xylan/chitin deacetylase (PgdA/CDA1 family)
MAGPPKKKKKVKKKRSVRQCALCRKILKAGSYISEGKTRFCSEQCLNEWKSKTEVSFPQAKPEPAISREDLLKGVTVSEFLDGRSDAEIEELADKLYFRRKTPIFTRLHIAVVVLVAVLLTIVFLTYRKKSEYYRIALKNKKKTRLLKAQIKDIVSKSVFVDTSALVVRYPRDGHTQQSRYLTLLGLGKDHMALTLIVNGKIKSHKTAKRGRFSFQRILLDRGENLVKIKGIDTSDIIYKKELIVWVGKREKDISVEDFKEGTPITAYDRHIDYSKEQSFVPNRYQSTLNFTRGDKQRKRVALTFDGGAHVSEADKILDTLKSRNVKVTVFLTGYFIRKYPVLVKRMAREGHVLGNHMDSHPHLTTWEQNRAHQTRPGVDRAFIVKELRKVEERYRSIGVNMAPLWRAPYGEQNRTINQWAESLGLKHVGWTQGPTWRTNLDTNDWVVRPGDRGYFTPDEVIKKIMSFGTGTEYGLNGGIVLLHIGTLRRQGRMVTKLGVLIDTLRTAGYDLVTVPEMLN